VKVSWKVVGLAWKLQVMGEGVEGEGREAVQARLAVFSRVMLGGKVRSSEPPAGTAC
jgi:hypothetical protein